METTCSNQPFGDGQVCTNEAGDAADEHFTGQKRDNETGNDYFGARYYVSAMGRFLSPDYSDGPDLIPHADLGNPQSFNLYAYVGNNPLNAFDPDGHDDCSTEQDFSGGNCDEANALPPSPPPPPPPPPPGGGSGSIAGSGSDTFLGPTPTASFGPNQKSPFAGFQLAAQQQTNNIASRFTQGFNTAMTSDAMYSGVNFISGYSDAFSMGLTKWANHKLGDDTQIDHKSKLYVSGAVTGAAVGLYVAGAKDGVLFGTRRGLALLNRADTIRIGWSLRKATGVATWTFRIGGAVAANWARDPGHLTLWPPSWWGGPPIP